MRKKGVFLLLLGLCLSCQLLYSMNYILKKLAVAAKTSINDDADLNRLMNVVKSIDERLFDAITKIDPNGERHFILINDFSVYLAEVIYSYLDGYPLIRINRNKLRKLNDGELKFILAHELAHYVHKDSCIRNKPIHNKFLSSYDYLNEMFSNVFKPFTNIVGPYKKEFAPKHYVSGQLLPYTTFQKALNRIRENEADKVAILDFGSSVDDAISVFKKLEDISPQLKPKYPEKETFKRTHPLDKARIEHFNQLSRELDVPSRKKKIYDWNALAQWYKWGRIKEDLQNITLRNKALFIGIYGALLLPYIRVLWGKF